MGRDYPGRKEKERKDISGVNQFWPEFAAKSLAKSFRGRKGSVKRLYADIPFDRHLVYVVTHPSYPGHEVSFIESKNNNFSGITIVNHEGTGRGIRLNINSEGRVVEAPNLVSSIQAYKKITRTLTALAERAVKHMNVARGR